MSGLTFPEMRMMQDHKRVAHDERVHHCESCKMDVVGLKKFTDTLYDKFKINMMLKIHVIVDHYGDYFQETGIFFRFTNGEHHEAIHHALKVFEAKKGFHIKKKLKSLIHQAKCLQSIISFNVLRAGYVRKENMRLTPARKRLSSTSSSSPKSSPRKGFPLKKTHVSRLMLNYIDE